jgi:predicted membrane-bound spermidine synthase
MTSENSTSLKQPSIRFAEFLAPRTAYIYFFFFVSGMPALVYQLIWQRVLFRIFGVNMESVTIVVTAFMLGLGIGSLIGSWLARRPTVTPLLLIAIIEVAICIFGLSSLRLFELADYYVQNLALPAKSVVAIALVFVPTALMGMTLPLLVGYLIAQSANVGLSTGSLYMSNTLGAVIGCVLSALVLFPFLGLQVSVWVAAGLNGTVAAGAFCTFLLQRHYVKPETPRASLATQSLGKLLSLPASLSLAFLGGFVSLSYEIFLLRLAAFASGTSPLVLAIVLAAFLLGVAAGAQRAAVWCEHNVDAMIPSRVIGFLLLNSLLGLLILPLLSEGAILGNGVVIVIVLAALLIARSIGVIFPVVAHLAIAPDRQSGMRVGTLYLSNILGSATGCMFTGFVLANLLGSRQLAILLTMLSFAIVLIFIRATRKHPKQLMVLLTASLTAAGAMIVFQEPLSANVFESMLYKSKPLDSQVLTRVVENRDGIIAVSRDGTVFGNGAYDGRFNVSLVHDTNGILRAYGLSLYHPRPREVLMIGLASGSWAQVIANNPDVSHLTIVEINPGYTKLISERPEVASLLKNPRVRIVIDDGRRWLKRYKDQTFDAIVANTTYHFRSNATNVLSDEFNNLIRAHLKTGGVYLFNATNSRRVERTGCASFRYGYRIINNVLASDTPIHMDLQQWKQNLLNYRIDGRPVLDVKTAEGSATLSRILAEMDVSHANAPHRENLAVESCASLLDRTVSMRVVTDDNMGTEWRYPLGLN